ncbi:branched-chain amino acid ABC transporter substrate-binding protein [Legionella sp.]|uniref:ABC transporter substrate-binding protein n=1 Tax=Legionella sp. TaxID=459 RepID=UPI003D0C2EA7
MKQTINIGIYAPFSTKSAYIGRNMLAAMEIARDQIKSAEINYAFHTLDAQPKNEHVADTLQKFIDARHINVLLTEGAASGTVVAPLAAKNNVIHFCLGCEAVADGKNNFQAQSPNHQRGVPLASTMKPEFVAQFKQEYYSQPVTEAGYAYDIFHLLNSSAVIAMKTNTEFSSKAIATQLLALEAGTGVMGSFSLNKNGIVYNKKTLTA